MAIILCPNCSRKVSDRAPACSACGHDPRQPAPQPPEAEPPADDLSAGIPEPDVPPEPAPSEPSPTPGGIHLVDCPLCRTPEGMIRDDLWRFPGGLRFIGWVLFLPAIVGLVAVAAMGVVTFGLSLLVTGVLPGIAGLVGGLILLMRRNVWRCTACGHVLDRA